MPDPCSESIRVVVVDDHELFRSGLATMLGARGVAVAGTADSGETALDVVERVRPDVVLMDLGLPGMSGVEATDRLTSTYPDVSVVVLTVLAEEADLMDAILAGASGYLLKDASIDHVIEGVVACARGESLIAPQLAGKLLRRIRSRRPQIGDRRPRLTEREHEVLELMIEGRDNAEIAKALYISQNTVKKHVSRILTELGVDNRVQAAVRAIRSGMD
jgi:DNA-binding NarL/FixJ family response regulator